MNRLKELRGNKTQEEVARALNIPRPTYRNYEAGTRQPDYETLCKIADYYKVSIDYILGRDVPIIPEEISNTRIAFNNGLEGLTQEDIADVIKYMEFLKNKHNN